MNKCVIVLATVSNRRSKYDPGNKMFWLVYAEHFTLERLQRVFDCTPKLNGLRARHVVGTVRSFRALDKWSDRHARRTRNPYPLTGWNGPIGLMPEPTVQMHTALQWG